MSFRVFVAGCLVIAATAVLTIFPGPLSLTLRHIDAYRELEISIVGGRFTLHEFGAKNQNPFTAYERWSTALDPFRYSRARASSFAPPRFDSGIETRFEFPLAWIAVAAMVFAALPYFVVYRRARRRLTRDMCVGCGYDLRGCGERCSECGGPRTPPPPHRFPLAILPRFADFVQVAAIAGGMFFVLIAGVGGLISSVEAAQQRAQLRDRLRAVDVARFVFETAPRLTGEVVTLEASQKGQLAPKVFHAGRIVLLGAGRFDIERRTEMRDVAIVGQSRDETTISLQLERASRVRIENVTIDCDNSPFIDIRDGGSVQLKNCVIRNYNSAAGGEDSISGDETTILIEDCTFNGAGGRHSGRGFGRAFDLRGRNRVYARRVSFVDNEEINRSEFITYDECEVEPVPDAKNAFRYSTGALFTRKSPAIAELSRSASPFAIATDDPVYVNSAANGGDTGDAGTNELLRVLGSRNDAKYWVGLLRSNNKRSRDLAIKRLGELKHPVAIVDSTAADRVPALLRQLAGPAAEDVDAARVALTAAPIEPLQAALIDPETTPELRKRLLEIIRLRGLAVPFAVEVEYTRVAGEIAK